MDVMGWDMPHDEPLHSCLVSSVLERVQVLPQQRLPQHAGLHDAVHASIDGRRVTAAEPLSCESYSTLCPPVVPMARGGVRIMV